LTNVDATHLKVWETQRRINSVARDGVSMSHRVRVRVVLVDALVKPQVPHLGNPSGS
jgi:hypothetical protein